MNLLNQFNRVYWLSGSPCAGKTTIAKQLTLFNLPYLAVDGTLTLEVTIEHISQHFRGNSQKRDPA